MSQEPIQEPINPYLRISRLRQPRGTRTTLLLLVVIFAALGLIAELTLGAGIGAAGSGASGPFGLVALAHDCIAFW